MTITDSPFRTLTAVEDRGDGIFTAGIDPLWTIGPKVHGGCLMAVCAAAAQRVLGEAELAPIALSANYLSAPDPGEVRLTTTIRRRGFQVSLVEVELSQNDRPAVVCTLTLGRPDAGPPRHTEALALAELPTEPTADAVAVAPDNTLGQIIHVARGCELRMDPATDGFLAGHQGPPVTRMWARPFAGDEADPDTAALFAIMAADVSPPVTMHRGIFGWTPTVQLTTYLRRQPAPGWLRVMASSTVIGEGWFEADHVIVDATGHVVVQSRQLAMLPKEIWQAGGTAPRSVDSAGVNFRPRLRLVCGAVRTLSG